MYGIKVLQRNKLTSPQFYSSDVSHITYLSQNTSHSYFFTLSSPRNRKLMFPRYLTLLFPRGTKVIPYIIFPLKLHTCSADVTLVCFPEAQ